MMDYKEFMKTNQPKRNRIERLTFYVFLASSIIVLAIFYNIGMPLPSTIAQETWYWSIMGTWSIILVSYVVSTYWPNPEYKHYMRSQPDYVSREERNAFNKVNFPEAIMFKKVAGLGLLVLSFATLIALVTHMVVQVLAGNYSGNIPEQSKVGIISIYCILITGMIFFNATGIMIRRFTDRQILKARGGL